MKLHKYFISILCIATCVTLLYEHAFAADLGPEVLKVKGLYIGMNIDEACVVAQKLLNAPSIKVEECLAKDYSLSATLSRDLELKAAIKEYLSGTPDKDIKSKAIYRMQSTRSDYSRKEIQEALVKSDEYTPKVTGHKISHNSKTIVEAGVDKKVMDIQFTPEDVGKLFNTSDLTMDQFTQVFMDAYHIPTMDREISPEILANKVVTTTTHTFTSSFGYKVEISKRESTDMWLDSGGYGLKITKIAKKSDHQFN